MTQHLHQLSEHDLRSLSNALRSGRIGPPFSTAALSRFIPSSLGSVASADLKSLADSGFSAAQIATTLDLLIADRATRPVPEETIELVTSGPESASTANRDTAVVVRELFASAKESVLVAGYAVYQGQSVFKALADQMDALPHLKVQMFLDIQRPHSDTTESSVLVSRFAHRFKTKQWPVGSRLPEVYYDPRSLELDSAKRACLHAKAIVVDHKAVFISSANFTEAAQNRNIEAGVLIRSSQLARQLGINFESLVSTGLLMKTSVLQQSGELD